jgi:hypothetical protein
MWLETLLAVIAAVATEVTLIWLTWFEILLGESPDGGNGSLEGVFALVWLTAAIVFSGLARR